MGIRVPLDVGAADRRARLMRYLGASSTQLPMTKISLLPRCRHSYSIITNYIRSCRTLQMGSNCALVNIHSKSFTISRHLWRDRDRDS